MPRKVRKRNGSYTVFDQSRIKSAIERAARCVNEKVDIDKVVKSTVNELNDIAFVETIQDTIEKSLFKHKYYETAKSFIIYRNKRQEIRELIASKGVQDELKLGYNTIQILEKRFLQRTDKGFESPKELFNRVADYVNSAQDLFKEKSLRYKFRQLLTQRKFLPSSTILNNAGTNNTQLYSVCSLPIKDDVQSIFKVMSHAARIQREGTGTGFNFSRLRPKGDLVHDQPIASGPVSFLNLFNQALGMIYQVGKRPGANMAILHVNHPDIIEFITAKEVRGSLQNFNLSVGLTKDFMQAVENGKQYNLRNPRTGKIVGSMDANRVLDLIATMAWKNADPGILFLDTIKQSHEKMEATSPCGEYPLRANQAICQGSIDISKHVRDGNIDYNILEETVQLSVTFLDNALTLSSPINPQGKVVLETERCIGLGVMGWADTLIMLGIPYDSEEAIEKAEEVMQFIHHTAHTQSAKIANRGECRPGHRLHKITAISPTGTTSLIAECSQGIEPLFALAYTRSTLQFHLQEIHPLLKEMLQRRGILNEKMLQDVFKHGIDVLPVELQPIFKTANLIKPKKHIAMQAAFQKYTDAAISKTVNLPHSATVGDVRDIIECAYKKGCKGITIYRDGSYNNQVIQ